MEVRGPALPSESFLVARQQACQRKGLERRSLGEDHLEIKVLIFTEVSPATVSLLSITKRHSFLSFQRRHARESKNKI